VALKAKNIQRKSKEVKLKRKWFLLPNPDYRAATTGREEFPEAAFA
jgi:hypothetical protein